jgi:diamine N-acetyltransferase
MTNTAQTTQLRRATSDDARMLAEFAARLFEDTFGPDNDPEDMRSYLAGSFSEEKQRGEVEDPAGAVFLAVGPADQTIGYDGVDGERPAEVNRIYADRAWHGRGVGVALMKACVEQARAWGCDALWLAVWERNPRAIAFYEKSGFRKVGRQTFLLGHDVQHDDVMEQSLP